MRLSAKSRALVVGVATAGLLVTYAITGGGDPSPAPETSPDPAVSTPVAPATPTPAPVPDDGPRKRPGDSVPRPAAPPTPDEPAEPSSPVLAEPMPAAEALPQLTPEQLHSSAAAVGRTVREYRDLVTNDDTYWLDRSGATYVVDPLPEPAAAGAAEAGGGEQAKPAGDGVPDQGPADLGEIDVTALHSNPDADLTLFIDVGGGKVPAGHEFNGGWRDIIPAADYPAWAPKVSGDDPDAARDLLIHDVWEAVAADYAAFDIDVTTEDPGADGLRRDDNDDTEYGATIAITDPPRGGAATCRCVGLAYVDKFDKNADKITDGYRLGFVFPRGISDDVDGVAQAVSHEAGHILGLEHDGSHHAPGDDNYYPGHGHWNAIMGLVDSAVIHTQWSKGDYPGANRQQDDVAVLTGHLGQRDDGIGDSRDNAATMLDGTASGIITSSDDVNVHRLGTCAGDVTIKASPTATRSNLDIELMLLDDAGAVLAPANPANTVDNWLMQGLGAEIEATLDEGDYWVQVRGGSNRTWATGGYDAYGSTGDYELTSTCSISSATQTTTVLSVDGDAESPTLTATTTRVNEGPVAGSVTFHSAGTTLETVPLVDGEATVALSGLTAGTHLFSADFTPTPGGNTGQPEPPSPSRSTVVTHEVPGASHLAVEGLEVDGNHAHLVLSVGPTTDGTLDVTVDRETLAQAPDQTLEVGASQLTVELADLTPGLHWVDLVHTPTASPSVVHSLPIRVEGPDLRPEVTLEVDGTDGVRTLTATAEVDGEPAAGTIGFHVDGALEQEVALLDGTAVLPDAEFADGVRMFGAAFIPADDSVAPAFATDVTQDVIHPTTLSVTPKVVKNKLELEVKVGPRDLGKLDVVVDGERHVVDVLRRKFTTRVGPFAAGRHDVEVTYRPSVGAPKTAPTFQVKVPKLAATVKVKAPKKKRRGTRAKLVIKVRSNGSPVRGKVRVKTKGWQKKVKLNRKGKVKIKTPRLRKGKKQRFVVRYLGNANTKAKRTKVVIRIRG